ncbi:MAG: hypothetical protein WC552_09605 [Candidatus Omnitrophota bacterium]
MLKEPLRILGVNPGTRYLGLAVFQDWTLLEWRICTFAGEWSAKKLNRIVQCIKEHIDLHCINMVVMKKHHSAHSSPQIEVINSKIRNLARKKGIKTYQPSIKEVEKIILQGGRRNKMTLAEKIVDDYPWLNHDWSEERLHKNPYLLRSIEAVGAAAACFRKYQG